MMSKVKHAAGVREALIDHRAAEKIRAGIAPWLATIEAAEEVDREAKQRFEEQETSP